MASSLYTNRIKITSKESSIETFLFNKGNEHVTNEDTWECYQSCTSRIKWMSHWSKSLGKCIKKKKCTNKHFSKSIQCNSWQWQNDSFYLDLWVCCLANISCNGKCNTTEENDDICLVPQDKWRQFTCKNSYNIMETCDMIQCNMMFPSLKAFSQENSLCVVLVNEWRWHDSIFAHNNAVSCHIKFTRQFFWFALLLLWDKKKEKFLDLLVPFLWSLMTFVGLKFLYLSHIELSLSNLTNYVKTNDLCLDCIRRCK